MSWKDALDILGRSRLMLTNFDPPVSPMPVEAVALGTVPMLCLTNIFEYKGPWLFEHIPDEDYYRGPVKEQLRRLMTEEDSYNSLLAELRGLGKGYTYEESYKICIQSLDEMLAESV